MKDHNRDLMKEYDIPISGLKTGIHEYHFAIDQSLMDYFGYEDHWDDAHIDAMVRLEKGNNVMRLDIDTTGDIRTWCDVTDAEFRLSVHGEIHLTVKIQDIPSNDEDVIVLSPLDNVLNVGQYIYESIVLSVPQKRYHPDYMSDAEDDEELDESFDDDIEQNSSPVYSTSVERDEQDKEEDIDPRWAKLKDILKN